jgi:hypothetical protein
MRRHIRRFGFFVTGRFLVSWFFAPRLFASGLGIRRTITPVVAILTVTWKTFRAIRPVVSFFAFAFETRALDLPQGAAQRFDLALIGAFLPIREFGQFQHFFHLIQKLLQRNHDLVDMLDGPADGRTGRLGIASEFPDAGRDGFQQRPGRHGNDIFGRRGRGWRFRGSGFDGSRSGAFRRSGGGIRSFLQRALRSTTATTTTAATAMAPRCAG